MTVAAPLLTVSITDRTLARNLTLDGLTLKVERYSAASDCGPKRCTIRADGNLRALESLLTALRGGVTVRDGMASEVWWGCLWSVTIYNGAIRYGATLDGMANSVNIVYLLQTINQTYSGAGSQATTGFSADSASVTEYGTIQKRIRGNNGSATAATARRTRELANRAAPMRIFGLSGQTGEQPYAVLECRSWLDTLGWQYYTNSTGAAAGFESNDIDVADMEEQRLGWGLAKTTVYFTANDRIDDTAFGLSLGFGDYFFVEDTASNNLIWTVDGPPAPAGDYVTVDPATVTTEAVGSVTYKLAGVRVAQSFTLSSNNPFYAAAIDIAIRKLGSPTDNVTVKLYTDSGSLPDSLLATGTITAAEIGTSLAYVTAVLDSQVSLVYGTTYWIVIERASATTDGNAYVVGVDEAASYSGGVLKLYTNATHGWKSRPTNADLCFRVAGVVETTTQISNIEGTAGEFLTGVDIDDASGLRAVPYQDGALTALQVVRNLAEYGTSNNKRLLMKVTSARRLVLFEEESSGTVEDLTIDTDGVPRDRAGVPIPPHFCPVGRWAMLVPMQFMPDAEKFVYVDEAEYIAQSGAWRVTRLRDRLAELNLTGIEQ